MAVFDYIKVFWYSCCLLFDSLALDLFEKYELAGPYMAFAKRIVKHSRKVLQFIPEEADLRYEGRNINDMLDELEKWVN